MAVLGHHDPTRYLRSLLSAVASAEEFDGVKVVAVIDAAGGYVQDLITAAIVAGVSVEIFNGGTAGKAKNYCLDLTPAGGHVFQVDGDDCLYPSAIQSILRDLAIAGQADLLGLYALDYLYGYVLLGPPSIPWPYGRCRDPEWSEPQACVWTPRVWSEKGADALRFDESMPAYSDAALCYQALRAHQNDELSVWISMSPDVMAIDKATPGSVTDDADRIRTGQRMLLEKRAELLDEHASNMGELPIVWPPAPLMTHEERRLFLRASE